MFKSDKKIFFQIFNKKTFSGFDRPARRRGQENWGSSELKVNIFISLDSGKCQIVFFNFFLVLLLFFQLKVYYWKFIIFIKELFVVLNELFTVVNQLFIVVNKLFVVVVFRKPVFISRMDLQRWSKLRWLFWVLDSLTSCVRTWILSAWIVQRNWVFGTKSNI